MAQVKLLKKIRKDLALRPKSSVQNFEQNKRSVIQVNTIKQNCLFAKAKIQKLIFNTLVDTGSAVRLISKKSIDKLDIPSSALHSVTTTLTSAEGNEMKVYGKIGLKFSISNTVFEHIFLEADLHQMSGTLGMDL
jgi:hypothetical protein